jgi:hypothetical protein
MPRPHVVIQVGHEPPLEPGFEEGTGASRELELVRLIGAALVDRLKRDGRMDVKRIPGKFPPEIRNASFKVDAFIALHGDAAGPTAQGYTFGFPPTSQSSKRFADLVAAEFARFHRSTRRRDNLNGNLSRYYGWKQERMPTAAPRILVEHGFLTHGVEREWLFDHVQELADAEFRAIAKLLGLDGRALQRTTTGSGTAAPIVPASRLLATPRASHAALERYVLKRNHAPHTDADARKVVKHYVTIAKHGGLDPLIAVAQMVLETNNLKSKWARTHKNLAGIGVTHNEVDEELVPKWISWEGAVTGHVGRLLAYAIPKGKGTAAQRALIKTALAKRPLPDDKRGVASTLAGLEGWADDPKYVAKIVRLAKEIRKA